MSITERRTAAKFAHRPMSYLSNTSGGSDVDRGRKCIFKHFGTPLQAPRSPMIGWTVGVMSRLT